MTCSVEGCGKGSLKRGLCNAHYLRMWRHGDPLKGALKKGEARDFVSVAAKHDGSECLLWPYAKNIGGGGVINRKGKMVGVPREVCRIAHGEPPSKYHQAAHSCGNGNLGCVNPKHLRWATPVENNQDKIAHGTSNRGEKHPLAKLTEQDVIEIRKRHVEDYVPYAVLAKEYGVSQATARDAAKGKNWSWLK